MARRYPQTRPWSENSNDNIPLAHCAVPPIRSDGLLGRGRKWLWADIGPGGGVGSTAISPTHLPASPPHPTFRARFPLASASRGCGWRARMELGASGSSRAVWVNSEHCDLCTVIANTASTACRRLGSANLMGLSTLTKGKARAARFFSGLLSADGHPRRALGDLPHRDHANTHPLGELFPGPSLVQSPLLDQSGKQAQ